MKYLAISHADSCNKSYFFFTCYPPHVGPYSAALLEGVLLQDESEEDESSAQNHVLVQVSDSLCPVIGS